MALVVGTNSYISVADADTYFADRLYATVWTNATTENKEKALIMATSRLDMRDYYGQPTDTTTPQPLKFPRAYLPLVDGIEYASDEIPDPIKYATCEEAIILLTQNPTDTPSENKYDRVKLGDMEVDYRSQAVSFQRSLVNGYLKGFVVGGSTGGEVLHG